MQKHLCLALLALTASFLTEPLRAAEPLRFAVWNLEWFPGKRPTASAKEADAHMKMAQTALKKINPDIFVGVEIRDWAAFHELTSAIPGLTVHAVSSFCDSESGELRPQQIGIASKLACRAAWWENWVANIPQMSRGFTFAALEHPDGGLLMVYGNHLKSNGGSNTEEGAKNVAAMRADQTLQLLAHREQVKKAFVNQEILGWIACGDFNTNHDNQFPFCTVVQQMTAGGYFNTWAATPKEKRLTWLPRPDSPFAATTFDYIFTDGIAKTDAFLIDAPKEISDHVPMGIRISKP
jgi:endonuclease/exonuclease/phosphatase family metal-dependent hydrolase